MVLPTEVLVLIVFMVGFPLFYMVIKSAGLPGEKFFTAAFLFLLLSNIFTVVEEFGFSTFFNVCEHLSLMASSVVFIFAINKLTTAKRPLRDDSLRNPLDDNGD